VLAVTAAETTPTADASLVARAQTGAERTAAVRGHADAALALALSPAPAGPVAAAEDLAVLGRLHADATVFYAAQLAAGTPAAAHARQVLGQRGVSQAAVAGYEIGYAPPGWTVLAEHLRGRGYTDPQLLAAGVGLATRRGSVVDRFRDRLMLPVRDPSGQRVAAFIGRALAQDSGTPKYLNSPQTVLYRKGDVLYGLGAQPTRQALAGGAQPVLVEGALDAIAVTCASRGRYAGVAPSGTALTAGQVAALQAAAGPLAGRGVTVAFDADPAGRQAALRSYDLLRTAGAWPPRRPTRRPGPGQPRPDPRAGGAPCGAGRRRTPRGPARRRAPRPLGRPARLGRGEDRCRARRRPTHCHLPARTCRPPGPAGRPPPRARARTGHQRRPRRRQPGP